MAAPTAVRKALPEVARTGGRWLKALPADTLVVEHGTFSSAEQAQKLKAKYKELGTARIIAVRKAPNADEWQYSVVTGPFRSEDRAKTYVSRLDWKSSTRIRATDKLKPLVASAP
jgi:SPOR domain